MSAWNLLLAVLRNEATGSEVVYESLARVLLNQLVQLVQLVQRYGEERAV